MLNANCVIDPFKKQLNCVRVDREITFSTSPYTFLYAGCRLCSFTLRDCRRVGVNSVVFRIRMQHL